jgi:hypothetical protein
MSGGNEAVSGMSADAGMAARIFVSQHDEMNFCWSAVSWVRKLTMYTRATAGGKWRKETREGKLD